MAEIKDLLHRLEVKFQPDPKRVVCLTYNQTDEEISRILNIIQVMSDKEITDIYNRLKNEFGWRHRDFDAILDSTFKEISKINSEIENLNQKAKRVFASYFTKEYSVEAAALFNPSIVPHPDQSGLEEGSLRFILTLRAVGEGHISSVEFKSGILDKENNIKLDPDNNFSTIESELIKDKTNESNVELRFDPQTDLSERVVFPVSPEESNGIEDVRMVKFSHEEDSTYYGTFTAYDGRNIRSKMLETKDFLNFKIFTLLGSEIKDKGMSLFPRKINGKYALISRQDGVNLWLMYSDDLKLWNEKTLLMSPDKDWQFGKIGNCGSPMETDDGWLLLTHGVGAMRKYEIGICLLDKTDPGKVLAYLDQPLISPNAYEREGYVPNVVYTCGALLHNNDLVIPYAMSDAFTGFAKVNVGELISKMKAI